MASDRKVVLITRPTRLDGLVARFNSRQQARFFVEHLGQDFSDYQSEHDRYADALRGIRTALGPEFRLQQLDWSYLPGFLFGPDDIPVAVGRDGLVVNALKYLDGQPLIGINPDPGRWDGVLCRFDPRQALDIVGRTVRGEAAVRSVTLARVDLSDGQVLHAVNDFFVGVSSHASAQYTLVHGERRERQSSSGVIVSTGLGSTGWMRSVIAGALGVTSSLGSRRVRLSRPEGLPWDSPKLHFSVREPFPSVSTGASLVFGAVTTELPLRILSHMAEGGVIFSDGVQTDFLEFNHSVEAVIRPAGRSGRIVVPQEQSDAGRG